MKLTRDEFEKRFAENSLRIALIGMSNIGKSFTGARIAKDYNFELIEVDKIIWESLGKSSMADFANWQGQPYTDGYAAREKESIALESKATAKAVDYSRGNAVLDTTGSVIYTEESVQDRLLSHWYIVHISAAEETLDRLKKQYFLNPKPLIWNGYFKQQEYQTPEEAILACYPDLLKSRAKAYSELADVTIRSEFIFDSQETSETIFEALKPSR